eukprot:4735396-Pyramimonas_sp.AAC.1
MGEESDLINKKYAAMIVEADEEASARLEQKVELTRLQFQAVVKDDNIDDLNKRFWVLRVVYADRSAELACAVPTLYTVSVFKCCRAVVFKDCNIQRWNCTGEFCRPIGIQQHSKDPKTIIIN